MDDCVSQLRISRWCENNGGAFCQQGRITYLRSITQCLKKYEEFLPCSSKAEINNVNEFNECHK